MNAIRFRPPVAPQLGHIFLRDGPEGLLGAFSDDFFLLFLLGWIAPAGQNPLGFVARLPGMGAFVNLCDRISKELRCLVLIVHHTGKDEARGARGHSLLLGAVSTEIEITRKQGEPGAIKVTKQRDGADGAEYGFVLKAATLGTDEDGDPVTSAVAIDADAPKRKPRPQGRIQELVHDAFHQFVLDHGEPNPAGTGFPESGRVHVVDLEPFLQFAAGRVTAASPSEARKAVRRAITRLMERHVLAMNGGKLWSLS